MIFAIRDQDGLVAIGRIDQNTFVREYQRIKLSNDVYILWLTAVWIGLIHSIAPQTGR